MNQKQNFKVNPNFDKTIQSFIDITATTLQPGTIRAYKQSIKNLIDFLTSQYPQLTRLSDLRRSPHIEGWLSYLVRKGLKKGTRHILICCVRRFLNDIYEWGWKDAPEPGLITSKDLPPEDKYLPKPISPEMDVKLQKFLKSRNELLPQGLLLLRKTGMRISELSDLEVKSLERVSDGGYVLHIPLGKLHSERIIPVDSETVETFERIIKLRGNYLSLPNSKTGKATQFLLVRNNCWKRPSYSGLRNALSMATKRSGITTHITPHQLRHTFATELLRGGISLPALMRLLGHKDIKMTLRYTAVSQEDLRQAYFEAIQKSKSMHLLLKRGKISGIGKQTENEINEPKYILNGINALITKIYSMRKDSSEKEAKKNLHRIAQRLRRVHQDINKTLNKD